MTIPIKAGLMILIAILVLFVPVHADTIPSEERIHLGDVIQYDHKITYLNADVIPREDQQTFRVIEEGADPVSYGFGTYLGGPVNIPISQDPGKYYGCPNIPIHTNKDIKKYCLLLFTVLPKQQAPPSPTPTPQATILATVVPTTAQTTVAPVCPSVSPTAAITQTPTAVPTIAPVETPDPGILGRFLTFFGL